MEAYELLLLKSTSVKISWKLML